MVRHTHMGQRGIHHHAMALLYHSVAHRALEVAPSMRGELKHHRPRRDFMNTLMLKFVSYSGESSRVVYLSHKHLTKYTGFVSS